MNTLVARLVGKGFQNPATIRVGFELVNQNQTKVKFFSESLDGLVGFGSAAKAVDQLISGADEILSERSLTKQNSLNPLLITAGAVVVVVVVILAVIRYS